MRSSTARSTRCCAPFAIASASMSSSSPSSSKADACSASSTAPAPARLVARKLELAKDRAIKEPPPEWKLEPIDTYESKVWKLP